MNKLFSVFIISIICFAAACKKSTIEQPIYGVWVEKSLRLDTLDFDIQNRMDAAEPTFNFLSKPYSDTVLNPSYPVSHASMYNYALVGDTIQMRNFLSSSTWYQRYRISFSADGKTFNIGKFYNRRALSATIEFEKIR